MRDAAVGIGSQGLRYVTRLDLSFDDSLDNSATGTRETKSFTLGKALTETRTGKSRDYDRSRWVFFEKGANQEKLLFSIR